MSASDTLATLLTRTAVVVMAAGASTRLGRPKQSLHFAGETLLERSLSAVRELGPAYPVVVLGEGDVAQGRALARTGLCVLHNPCASRGMSSSLRLGLHAARAMEPALSALLCLVCDQPHVHAELLRALLRGLASGHAVAAARYGDVLGVPAAFAARTFHELDGLEGDEGARRVIRRDPARVLAVPFAEGSLDIDHPEDLARAAAGLPGALWVPPARA